MPARKKAARPKNRTNEPVTSAPRTRLSPAERQSQIVEAAAGLVVRQGYLPLSMEELARAAGTSKALLYNYFPTQYDLFNGLIARELGGLATAGLETASRVNNLDQAALLCAMLYFEYVAKSGPLLHILLADRYMADHIDPQLTQKRNNILHRLARLGRRELPLSRKEMLVAIAMAVAIPEEAGSLVFHGELDAAVARQICHGLVLSSLDALRDPARALLGSAADERA